MHNPDKCRFYMPPKNRYCAANAKPGCQFCGNHLFLATQQGKTRVPCPIDPRHTVLETELELHVKRCPSLMAMHAYKAQPYVAEAVNEGSGEDPDLKVDSADFDVDDTPPLQQACGPFTQGNALRRARWARSIGWEAFAALVARVEAAYLQVCKTKLPVAIELPSYCQAALATEKPGHYTSKHGSQQASIIGNMERMGLLQRVCDSVVVEYGAGKGYLSGLLADVAPVRELLLTDVRRCFRNKADRALRHLQLQRVHVDIKDLDVAGLPGMERGQRSWLGIGKHLCGAATDYMLRSCSHAEALGAPQPPGPDGAAACDVAGRGGVRSTAPGAKNPEGQGAMNGDHAKAAGPLDGLTAAPGPGGPPRGGTHSGLQGFAVAPCCHHRCGWRAYVGKATFRSLGFSPEEFEVVSWMTGWALCGHNTPAGKARADGGSDEQDDEEGEGSGEEADGSDAGDAAARNSTDRADGAHAAVAGEGAALCGVASAAMAGDAAARNGTDRADGAGAAVADDGAALRVFAGTAMAGDRAAGADAAVADDGRRAAAAACDTAPATTTGSAPRTDTGAASARMADAGRADGTAGGRSRHADADAAGAGAPPDMGAAAAAGAGQHGSTSRGAAGADVSGASLPAAPADDDDADVDTDEDASLDLEPLDDEISNQISQYLAEEPPARGPAHCAAPCAAADVADGPPAGGERPGKRKLAGDGPLGCAAGAPQSPTKAAALGPVGDGTSVFGGERPVAAALQQRGTAAAFGGREVARSATATWGGSAAPGGCGVAAGGAGPLEPDILKCIPPLERVRLGQLCKELIDMGRLQWMRQQGWHSELVVYCPPEVSGENKLLLAVLPS